MDRLVKPGWFRNREEIISQALRRFLDSYSPDLRDKVIRGDVEWGLRGRGWHRLGPCPGLGWRGIKRPKVPVIDLWDLEMIGSLAPTRKLVYITLLVAITYNSSEVRFEPQEREFKLSHCVAGTFYDMVPPPLKLAPYIINVIKIMADLDITRSRVPQEGRSCVGVGDRSVDLLVSMEPTPFGESAIVRIVDPAARGASNGGKV